MSVRHLKSILLLAVICLFAAVTVTEAATPMGDNGYEDNLQEVIDGITSGGSSSVNMNSDQVSEVFDTSWLATDPEQVQFTYVANLSGTPTSFGIYSSVEGIGRIVEIFSSSDTVGDQAVINIENNGNIWRDGVNQYVVFTDGLFSFYLATSYGGVYFSDSSMNADNYDHMVAYEGMGDTLLIGSLDPIAWTYDSYMLGFEDLYFGHESFDYDYQDMVVLAQSVTIVPEPISSILFTVGGALLAGRGFLRRRKRNYKTVY